MESMVSHVAAVIGGGTMGHGIAQVFAQHGWAVTLVDKDECVLKKALSNISLNLKTLADCGLVESEAIDGILSRITMTVHLDQAAQNAEYVTEAVTEDMNLKRQIFRVLDENTAGQAVLASNTSGLDIELIASSTSRPGRVIGTNWWNPPHIIPLVEIMVGRQTSSETIERTKSILEEVGKKPIILLKAIPGFIGNRLQIALLREALSLIEKGYVSVEDMDRAVKYGPGFRWAAYGPLEVADFGGLDVFRTLAQDLYPSLEASREIKGGLSELVRMGHRGVKDGRGFHEYSSKNAASLLSERDRKLIGILRLGL
jgi:3-hydroxybutyryl-CoA dehydrogenase